MRRQRGNSTWHTSSTSAFGNESGPKAVTSYVNRSLCITGLMSSSRRLVVEAPSKKMSEHECFFHCGIPTPGCRGFRKPSGWSDLQQSERPPPPGQRRATAGSKSGIIERDSRGHKRGHGKEAGWRLVTITAGRAAPLRAASLSGGWSRGG